MKKLSAQGQRWLKSIHILFAIMWAGGGIAMLFIAWFAPVTVEGALHGTLIAQVIIDDYIIIPGAIGCLVTGLIYSIWTRWGFFIHWWITAKWSINVFGILFGTFFLGPWLNSLPPMAMELGNSAMQQAEFARTVALQTNWGAFQVSTVLLAGFLSTLKPWGRTGLQK